MYTLIASNPATKVDAKYASDSLDQTLDLIRRLVEEDAKDEKPPRFTEYRVAVGALHAGGIAHTTRRECDAIESVYVNQDYLDAYSAHTDMRVEKDPHEAVGGQWEEVGNLQFTFLVASGLQPHHRMLDIGCGTLRGGRHFIRSLDPGNYVGMDISAGALAAGEKLVEQEGLTARRPQLVHSAGKNLRFEEFSEPFDFLLAQSVFTHLMPEHIEECFEHIGRIMNPSAAFFFTIFEAPEFTRRSVKDFSYPRSYFTSLAERFCFRITDCSKQYPHPRGQVMLKLHR